MALTSRDWWMLAIGLGVGFFIFTTIGRRTIMAAMGMGEAEIERALAKVEAKSEERRHI
jgi:hypothetical protein